MVIIITDLIMKEIRILFFLFLLPGATTTVAAQNTLQVVTKKIEKSFPFRDGYEVNIEGEKAAVVIQSWEKNEILVRLELTAKHADQATAERDLEAMNYVTQRVKNKIYLRNYLSAAEGSPKPESNFTASYVIYVPERCPVYLKNYFGEASISNLTNRLRVHGEFSKIGLENIQGVIDLKTRFGDILGQHLDGQVAINARRSDIILREISGSYDITAQYGVIKIFAEDQLLKLNIDADRSDVYFYNPDPETYAYNLTANYGRITFPSNLEFTQLEDQPDLKKISFRPPQEFFANITITVTIGDIYVEKARQPRLE